MRLFVLISVLFLSMACQQTEVSVNQSKTNSEANRSTTETAKVENTKSEGAGNPFKDGENKSSENKTVTNSNNKNSTPSNSFEKRCGWLANPTPANFWLNDANGEWTISVQGGYQAEGTDYLPDFGKEWVKTNGNYGYGCVCMDVKVDNKEKKITSIKSASVRPLSACRNDKALKEPKE